LKIDSNRDKETPNMEKRKRVYVKSEQKKARNSEVKVIGFLNLPAELLVHIFSFVVATQYKKASRSIRLTCKSWNEAMGLVFNPYDTRNVLNRLKSFSPTLAKNIPKFLKHNGFVIGGSFPLQCVTKMHFEDSDVDIFVQTERKPFSRDPPKLSLMCLCESCKYMNLVFNGCTRTTAFEYEGSCISNVVYVCEYEEGGKKIQFISKEVYGGSLLDELAIDFDLSICKVFYDGKRIHMNEDALKRTGVWCALAESRFVKDKFRFECVQRSHKRIKKYEQRGFKISNKISQKEYKYIQGIVFTISSLDYSMYEFPRSEMNSMITLFMKKRMRTHFGLVSDKDTARKHTTTPQPEAPSC
jgi:F-box associated protein